MSFINIEIKARTQSPEAIRKILNKLGAEFKGTDLQTDTYFNVPKGRLKLRSGNIENTLIYYERLNTAGPKSSHFNLVPVADTLAMKALLLNSLGLKVEVVKQREIFFIGNVKFHLDTLEKLGTFVEIEASNKYAALSTEALSEQCNFYIQQFGIRPEDMLSHSYSDMLLAL